MSPTFRENASRNQLICGSLVKPLVQVYCVYSHGLTLLHVNFKLTLDLVRTLIAFCPPRGTDAEERVWHFLLCLRLSRIYRGWKLDQ